MVEAWYMDEATEEDQRKPHRCEPNQPVSLELLSQLGVFYWKVGGREAGSVFLLLDRLCTPVKPLPSFAPPANRGLPQAKSTLNQLLCYKSVRQCGSGEGGGFASPIMLSNNN